MDLIDILLANKLIEKKLPPAILNLRGSVATTSQLPLTNNHKGDVWVVQSNNAEYVWMSDNASGSLSDYEDFGPVIDLSPYRTSADQDVIDSSKQSKVTASGILKGDGNGGVSAAVAGTDYGTYSKPVDGIPSSDFASGVQTSLGKADTALQSSSLTPYRTASDQDVIDSGKQSKVTASGILKGDGNGGVSAAVAGTDYGTYSKPSGGIPSNDLDSTAQSKLLPSVTNVDDGKFARVVNGAWAAVTVPQAAGGDF